MSRKMLVIGMVCLVALLSLAITTPAQALDLTFYVHAWDNSLPGQMPAVGVDFLLVCFDEGNQVVVEEMFNPGGGGLYWRYLPDWWLLERGAETWEIRWQDDEDWDLVDPGDPNQFQGDINWGGNNPCDPQDWWFDPDE